MSEIETTVDYRLDLTVHAVSGDLRSQDILKIFETYYEGNPTILVLWEFTNSKCSNITGDDLREADREP